MKFGGQNSFDLAVGNQSPRLNGQPQTDRAEATVGFAVGRAFRLVDGEADFPWPDC